MWVVCDGADPHQTVLLSSLREKESGWVTSSAVRFLGQCSYNEAMTWAEKIKLEHLAKSRMSEHKVCTVVFHVQLYSVFHV